MPYEWTIGWDINARVASIFRSDAAQRTNGIMPKTAKALDELYEAGLVERRLVGAFTGWRRKHDAR